MDKNFAIEQLNADVKNWQESSEAYRLEYEQTQSALRSVIEAYDRNDDLDGWIDVARHILTYRTDDRT